MSEKPDTATAADALDATISRTTDSVRRGRRDRGFLKRLGLSLPVTVDDVKQAFYARARETHPDHAGSPSDFKEVQRAFDEAVEFAKRNGKRLPWIGAVLPLYIAQRNVIELIEKLGGTVVVKDFGWLEDTVGSDFAQLANRLIKIDLSNLPVGDAELDPIVSDADALQFVETILLTDTDVTDRSVMKLTRAVSLRHIDLRGTGVSYSLRRKLARLPGVERVEGASRWGELFRKA